MKIELYNSDNLEIMAKMPDESIDIICIDPPYLYLKNQKLERAFDEKLFFLECKRLLTKDGFIVMFGRGESFYRWNTILADLGFSFKEEIIWNKRRTTTPALSLGRVHETISIYTKSTGKINKNTIPYVEIKLHDIDKIVDDIKRIGSTIKNTAKLTHIINCLEKSNKIDDLYKKGNKTLHKATYNGNSMQKDVGIATLNSMLNGCIERSIIDDFGIKYGSIHPTQKPVRLLERLLKLVIPMRKDKIVIADWFAGSFSCGEAVINLQKEFPEKEFQFIGTEIDEEYFLLGKNRIEKVKLCTT